MEQTKITLFKIEKQANWKMYEVEPSVLSANTLIVMFCDFNNITIETILAKCNKRKYAYKRFALAYVLFLRTDLSVIGVGRVLGKHHVTILHSIKTIELYSDVMQIYKDFINKFNI